MRRQVAPKILALLALPVLMLATAQQAQARQCATLEDCRERVRLLTAVEAKQTESITIKNERIAAQADQIADLEAQLKEVNSRSEAQTRLADTLQKQVEAQEEIKKALRDQVEDYRKLIALNEASIKDRNDVIRELVKVSRRSALEKIADAIPSVAGIIALALVNN